MHQLSPKTQELLARSFGDRIPSSPEFDSFVRQMDEYLTQAKSEIRMVQRSMELGADELLSANNRLQRESEKNAAVIAELRNIITALDPSITTQDIIGLSELVRVVKTLLEDKLELENKQRAAKLERDTAFIVADEATRSKSALLSTVSHELRTPLNGIIGMVSLLTESPLTTEQREYLEIIRISGKNLLDVVNDILDFSKLEAGRLVIDQKPFSITNCVEEIAELFVPSSLKSNNRLFVHFTSKVPENIVGDEARLRQVLVNLVGNALKFTDNGEVCIHIDYKSTIGIDYIQFKVTDTGVGIEKKLLKRIFSAFTQYDSESRNVIGTGLGLAISKKLASLMRGTLEVDSEKGIGTTFTFTIPTAQAESSVADYYDSCKGTFGNTVIAVISDSKTYCNSVADMLDRWDVRHVEYSDNGSWQSIGEGISCVLIDYTAFNGAGGKVVYDLRKRFNFQELPIVLQCPVNKVTSVLREFKDMCNMVLTVPTKRLQLFDTMLAAHAEHVSDISNGESRQYIQRNLADVFPLKILVVDDTDLSRRQLTTMLRLMNYEPEETHLGVNAVELASMNHYDLILMDLQLPGGSGYETAQTILNQDSVKKPMIVALTAVPDEKEKQLCYSIGFKHYTAKPMTLSDMHELMQSVRSKQDS